MQYKFNFLLTVLLLFSLLVTPDGRASALTNYVQDPSLEAAYGSTVIWQQSSTNSDSPVCKSTIVDCTVATGGPRTGTVWGQFGGLDWSDPDVQSPETADIYQNVTFPNSCGVSLQFYLWIGDAGGDANDVFNVLIDNNPTPVFSANATQQSTYLSYTLVNINLSPSLANGAVHKVEFKSVQFKHSPSQTVTFNLDDISIVATCFTISGNAGTSGATLNYTGGSTSADGSGNYSFGVPSGWSGTVTPSKSGYIFSPINKTYSNIVTNQSGQNYTATAVYTISGNVEVGGATLSYTDGTPKTTTSESNGNYSFVVPSNWSGTVTPSHPCFSFNPTNIPYSNVSSDQTSQNYTSTPIPSSGCANIDIAIAGASQGSFGIPSQGTLLQVPFDGINNGPVKISSTVSIMSSERVIYKVNNINTSFSEMMALPNGQLNTIYWLPWYNNVDLDTQLRFANVSSNPATVHLYIGGQEVISGCTPSSSPYTLAAGASLRVSCAGVNNGPVKIQSDQNIVAAERVIYKVNNINTSFSEMMGLPNGQLNTIYWLPWYNNVDLDTQLRFGVP